MERLTVREPDGIVDVIEQDCSWNLAVSNAIDKLADYEDAEEQGRLIEFPVSVGQHLWLVNDYGIIEGLTVHELNISSSGQTMLADSSGVRAYYSLSRIGETIFITHAEAEARQKEFKNEMTETKAVLVLNSMPEKCDNCPLYECNYSNDYTPICNYKDRKILSNEYGKRPNWCPLKELPPESRIDDIDITETFAKGYNACLKDIKGD